jgi:tripartite-type tricarboxylate transporter receptor subunit TctC
MPTARFAATIACILSLLPDTGTIHAQGFPNKPLRIISAEPGGANDFAARLIAQALTGPLGQQVIVDNRQATIGPTVVAKALPDGHTLILTGSPFVIVPLILKEPPYDPVKDFIPITIAVSSPNILVVPASLPVKSVGELIALAKSKPGFLNYGSSSTFGSPRLAGDLFKTMAELDIVIVGYKSTAQAIASLIGGETHLLFASAGSVTAHIKSGRVRALAVTSARPSDLLPGLPTVAASLPGYEYLSSFGMLAPVKTPVAIITRLHKEISQVLSQKELKEKMAYAGLEVIGGPAEDLAARIKADIRSTAKLIKDAGIRPE